MSLNNIVSKIKEAKSVVIMPHISVDGDGLGSSIALGLALRKQGKKADIYIEEETPYIYGFLPGLDLVKVYGMDRDDAIRNYDAAVALDTGDLQRLGKRAHILENAKISVNIDHHATNSEFAFYNYVHPGFSAVGEIVYQMINMMEQKIDADMATCLYVAIVTDTGGFKFSNTTAVTHQIVAGLIDSGINVSDISQKVFDTTSLEKTRLMGEAINSLELYENGKAAFIILTDETMKKIGARDEDCEGIVNLGRNIRGVEVAVLMRQRDNGEIKINLRSKNYVDVAAIASMYKGGGHKRASGCAVEGKTIEAAKELLLKDIKEAL